MKINDVYVRHMT